MRARPQKYFRVHIYLQNWLDEFTARWFFWWRKLTISQRKILSVLTPHNLTELNVYDLTLAGVTYIVKITRLTVLMCRFIHTNWLRFDHFPRTIHEAYWMTCTGRVTVYLKHLCKKYRQIFCFVLCCRWTINDTAAVFTTSKWNIWMAPIQLTKSLALFSLLMFCMWQT